MKCFIAAICVFLMFQLQNARASGIQTYIISEDGPEIQKHFDIDIVKIKSSTGLSLEQKCRDNTLKNIFKESSQSLPIDAYDFEPINIKSTKSKNVVYRVNRELSLHGSDWVSQEQYSNVLFQRTIPINNSTHDLCILIRNAHDSVAELSLSFLSGKKAFQKRIFQLIFPVDSFESALFFEPNQFPLKISETLENPITAEYDILFTLVAKNNAEIQFEPHFLKEVFINIRGVKENTEFLSFHLRTRENANFKYNKILFLFLNTLFLSLLFFCFLICLWGLITSILNRKSINEKIAVETYGGAQSYNIFLIINIIQFALGFLIFLYIDSAIDRFIPYFGFRFSIFIIVACFMLFNRFWVYRWSLFINSDLTKYSGVFNSFLINKFNNLSLICLLILTNFVEQNLNYIVGNMLLFNLCLLAFSSPSKALKK